jgi:MraZ protein
VIPFFIHFEVAKNGKKWSKFFIWLFFYGYQEREEVEKVAVFLLICSAGIKTMAGFIGKERHAIDEKGRLMIPVKFRRKFGLRASASDGDIAPGGIEALYIMKTPDRSLEFYEPFIWDDMRRDISALSDFNPDERLLKTLMYESLEIVELDRQGRVALSREFLEHAGITKDVVIIGADTKMIIWEPERLSALLRAASTRFASLAGRYF